MNLGIIGCGAIGTDVAKAADEMKEIKDIYIYDIDEKKANRLKRNLKKVEMESVKDFLKKVDVVFEAASQNAVKEYAEGILQAEKDLVIMSVGSLFDDKFRKKLEETAREKHCRIYLPSGAVCGIDGVLSASVDTIDEVTLVTTKPPESLGENYERRTTVFKGNARDAVKKFPKNIGIFNKLKYLAIDNSNNFKLYNNNINSDIFTDKIISIEINQNEHIK